jgi:tetratricopeptide (TPR) repeat protein
MQQQQQQTVNNQYNTALPTMLNANNNNYGDNSNANAENNNGFFVQASNVNSEMSIAVQSGMDLLNKVRRLCPGFTCCYVELARVHVVAQLAFDDAYRVLNKCLQLQSQNSSVLLMLAKVEAARGNTSTADRALEQALGCDFSIRSVHLFRLVKAFVRAQQGRLDDAIAELEQLLASPEYNFSLTNNLNSNANNNASSKNKTSFSSKASQQQQQQQQANNNNTSNNYSSESNATYADAMRMTLDDKVLAFVAYATLLSRVRRLKEAQKVLSHAKVMFAGFFLFIYFLL